MANRKISALASASSLTGDEQLPIVSPVTGRKGNKKITIDELVSYVVETAMVTTTGLLGQAFVTWSGSGLRFDVIYPRYIIDNNTYRRGTTTITLDAADPTNPRIDVIALDSTGVIKITGDPAADPNKPVVDPDTQIELSFVTVAAGATVPDTGEYDEEIVYKENIEWTGSNEGLFTANFADTADPYEGSKCIQAPESFESHYPGNVFSPSSHSRIKLTDGTNHNKEDYTHLKFWFKLPPIQPGGNSHPNTTRIYVQFANGLTTTVSDELEIANNSYGFLRLNEDEWQLITIPLNVFNWSASVFNSIWIGFYGGTSDPDGYEFQIDNITLPKVDTTPPEEFVTAKFIETDNGIVTVDQLNDTIKILGTLGTKTFSIGKNVYVKMDNEVRQADTSVSPIELGLEDLPYVMIVGSVSIGGARTWQFSRTGEEYFDSDDSDSLTFDQFFARRITFRFDISGVYAQQMPLNSRMPLGTYGWDDSVKQWTPIQSGTYQALITFDGLEYFIEISGPF